MQDHENEIVLDSDENRKEKKRKKDYSHNPFRYKRALVSLKNHYFYDYVQNWFDEKKVKSVFYGWSKKEKRLFIITCQE